jgi:CheY-like chemotaxis protein
MPAILCVDDDRDDQLLAELAHRESGVENPIAFVSSGPEALEYLRATGRYTGRSGEPRPAIVLLDLNMPGMDGLETLGRIRADADLRAIPVIILTTSSSAEDIRRSYEAGANAYVVKPASFSSLTELVRRLCLFWFEVSALPDTEGR